MDRKHTIKTTENEIQSDSHTGLETENKLKENTDKYHEITNQIPGMIFNFVLHQDGSFSVPYVSGKVLEYSGYSPEEIINNPKLFMQPVYPEDLPIIQEKIKLSAETLKEYSVEHRLNTPDGEIRWFHVKSNPTKLDNGDILWNGISVDITEHKLLEQALIKSEEQYHAVSGITSDYAYAYRVEPDGNIVNEWVTGALKRITGFSRKEVMKRGGWESLIHQDDLHIPMEQLKLLFSNQSKAVEYRIIDKEGNIRWMKDFSKPIWDKKNNRLKKIYGAVQEITHQKKAEDGLRESEERYKCLFHNNYSIMLLIDPENGDIVDANPAAGEFYGWLHEDLIKKKISDINISPKEEISEAMAHAKKLEQNHFFFRHRLSNNEIRDVEVYSNPIYVNGKQLLYSIIHDITERRKAQAKLRESEKHYREYFEENIAGAYISSPDGKLIDCNQEYLRIFGFEDTKEGLNTPIRNYFINPSERIKFINLLKKQKRVTGYTPKLKKADGTPVYIIENASGVFDEDDNLIHIRGFLVDVTEQKKLEKQLLQAQKMESIGTLAGGIAHDFNNILFPVLGHTEILLEDIPEDSPTHSSLKEIHKGAIKARDLVKQILTFSRQDEVVLTTIKLEPIVKEAIKFIRSTIPTSIEIIEDISINCGSVKADATQIHQIVMNLTANAYHALEDTGGKLTVSLKEIESNEINVKTADMRSGRYACLTVSDTGIGMKKTITEKIFDPFFTTKEKGKGTGMGLSVVHGIVAHMKGVIQVDSRFGKGTQFNVYLPIERRVSEKKRKQFEDSIQKGSETIMIVDDQEDVVIMEEKILKRLGYQVVPYTSSIEALDAFCKTPEKFDMVITDMAMPSMSGDMLAVELIKIRPDIPILLCTGFSETMSEEKVASIGIKGFVMKPITINTLAQKVRHILDKTVIEPPSQ